MAQAHEGIFVLDEANIQQQRNKWKSRSDLLQAFNITVSADTLDFNLATAMTGLGWNGTDAVVATITVNSGVKVGATNNSGPAFTVPALPAGSTVTLTNNGRITGAGGPWGDGGTGAGPHYSGWDGQSGGTALKLLHATTIVNTNGKIYGGGGGGGGGGATGGGNGGPGGMGAGWRAQNSHHSGESSLLDSGESGTGNGGSGGAPGLPGANGSYGEYGGGAGGAAGKSIDGVSYAIFSGVGDVRGPQV